MPKHSSKKSRGRHMPAFIGRIRKFVTRNMDLLKKIAFTILCLFIFRFGANVVVSSVNVSISGGDGLFLSGIQLFNMLMGSDLTSFTIFALGLSPFITASIIIELLSNDVIPPLSRWKRNGEDKKKNTASNITGLCIAIVQAAAITLTMDRSYEILRSSNIYSYIYTITLLVGGSCFLFWLAHQIDIYGIGNGSSIIIAAGILYNMPSIMNTAYNEVVTYKNYWTFLWFGLLALAFLSVIFFIVYIELSERRIKTIHAEGKNNVIGSNDSYIPIKVNVGGVVPVIFASSVLQAPAIICTLMDASPSWLKYLSTSNPVGMALYSVMILFFVHYYAHTLISGKDVARNLQRNGNSIVSVRAGKDTAEYIDRTVSTVAHFGSVALLLIALIPVVLPLVWDVAAESGLTVGGTSLIIVASVCIELFDQVKAETTRKKYSKQSIFWK